MHEATVSFINNIPALLVFCENFMKHAVVDSLVRGSCYYNADRVVLETGQIHREITSRMETLCVYESLCVFPFVSLCVSEKERGRHVPTPVSSKACKHENSSLQQYFAGAKTVILCARLQVMANK